MNKIVKLGENDYKMICESGKEYKGKMHLEKGKTWLVRFPKDNDSGRQFFTQSLIDATGEYEFETKTEHRTLGSSNWRSKLTEEEKTKLADLERQIEEIKTEAMKRETPKLEKNTPEWLEATIAKLQHRLLQIKSEQ